MDWIPTVLNWILGLVSVSVVGIVGMFVRLEVLVERIKQHETHCAELHGFHTTNIKELWLEIEAIKDGGRKL